MLIRALRSTDATAAAPLCSQLDYPSSPEQVERRLETLLASSDQGLFGAELEARLVGWVHVQRRHVLESEPFAEVCALVVDENVRGRGIGRALMEVAEDWARRRGHAQLRLRSNVTRTRTHDFYRQLGYTRTKTSHLFVKPLSREN